MTRSRLRDVFGMTSRFFLSWTIPTTCIYEFGIYSLVKTLESISFRNTYFLMIYSMVFAFFADNLLILHSYF